MSSTQDRYRLMVEHASDVVFTTDMHGRLDWVSPSIRKLTGDPPELLLGRVLTDFVLEVDVATVLEQIEALHRGEETKFVGRAQRPDGDPIWVEATAAPLRDDDGVMIGAVGAVRDVNDVVVARQALAVSDEYYRMLAEHMTDVVLRLDPDLRILWVSPSMHAVLGLDPDALVGTKVCELFHPGDWEELAVTRGDLTRHDNPAAPARPIVARVRTGDGRWVWIASRPSPITDPDGHLVGVVTTWNDVDDLVHAQQAAQAKQDQLRATLDTLFDPHVLLQPVRDTAGAVVDFIHVEANDAACRYNRRARRDLVGLGLRDVAPKEVADELVRMLSSVADAGVPLVLDDFEFPDRMHELTPRRFDVRACRVGDCVGQTWRDVTERHELQAHLSHLATHDPLTGLANRAALLDEIERALNAGRRAGRMVAVLMLDLDHFKDVNDEHDHGVGDQLLKTAAHRLERQVRAGDLVCRLGGDEFVVVMRDLDDSSEAMRVANRIVEEFRQPLSVAGFELRTTTSVGVAVATRESSPEDLVHEADIAMYRAKEAGRDRTSVYNEDLRVAAIARVALETQLRPALDLGELAVYYQPEVDLLTGRISAVEALLRWHHPSGELYSAEQFIDVAEEIGVMVESGNWVVREACARAAAWNRARPDRLLTLRLNLSKQQLAEHGLGDAFAQALADTGVSPKGVCVEIAESSLIHTSKTVHENLEHLKQLGVHLAIDNFGTGYAALAFLRERPVDMVKIDRSYIGDIDNDDYARRLVAGISALARQLGLHVGAEGVETLGQVRLLRELGCTSAQGFLFSPAVPGDEILRLLDHSYPVA